MRIGQAPRVQGLLSAPCRRSGPVLRLQPYQHLQDTFKTSSRLLETPSRPSQTLSGYFGYHPARLLPEATELRRITPRTTELRRRQVRTRSNATKPRVTFHVIPYSVLTPCCALLPPRNYISTPFRTHPPLVFSPSLKRQSYCYLPLQAQAPSFLCQIDHL